MRSGETRSCSSRTLIEACGDTSAKWGELYKQMRNYVFALMFALSLPAAFAQTPAAPKSSQRALLDQYCVTCHNQRTKTAGVMFDTMDPADVSKHGDIWEKAVRKLRGGMMPPPGARRPDQQA